jgi:protoporphyrinogen oxidase
MILIIGAGLAGLSTAYHLGNEEYQIYEKGREVGGLCRSFKQDGFIFDYTGHLLHIRHDYTKKLLEKFLPNKLITHFRRASVYSKGVFTPYPFQANMHGLPKEVIKECIIGFIEAKEARKQLHKGDSEAQNYLGISFKDWIIYTFGKGIAKHFMIPYNEKTWKTDLGEISSEWVDWSIPVPSLDEVVGGALGFKNPRMGYSAQFLYPEEGGIEVLPKAFLPYVRNLYCNKKLISVDLKEKRAWFDDDSSVKYDHLVSTIPLPELLDVIKDLPSSIAMLRKGLRYVSVLDVNLGIDIDTISDQHWVYFPEPEIKFYRVGFYSNFSSSIIPPKSCSLYVEVSYLPNTPLNKSDVLEEVVDSLKACGFLKSKDQIIIENVLEITYAYVIHDNFRLKNLPKIMAHLNSHGIFSIGRYGSWRYMSMEDALLQGREVVKVIHG